MSQWIDRINTHPVFASLKSLGDSIDQATPKAEETSVETLEALERISRGYRFVDGLLRRIDPVLAVPAWLDPLQQQLTNVYSHVNNFHADGNMAHLTNANSHLDTVLSQCHPFHVILTPDDMEDLREASSSYRRACGQLVRKLDADVGETKSAAAELKNRLNDMVSDVSKQKQRLDTAITDFIQRFNDQEAARTQEFSTIKEGMRTEVAADLEARKRSVEGLLKEGETKIEGLLRLIDETNQARLSEMTHEHEQFIKALSDHRQEAERLVGIISTTGMVGGYQKVANQEHKAFITWRRVTFCSIVLLAGFTLYTFFSTVSEDFQTGPFANRVYVTLTLAILAAYSAFQADRHRKAEIENRQMELELASFDPFLASLEDGERNALKKTIADRLFGRRPTRPNDSEHPSPKNVLDVLKAVENLIKSR